MKLSERIRSWVPRGWMGSQFGSIDTGTQTVRIEYSTLMAFVQDAEVMEHELEVLREAVKAR